MSRILVLLIFVISIFGFRFATKPCAKPIIYELGSFDERFQLTRPQFLQALSEAEEIWEAPISKDLFSYVPERGKLAVNLVYDYRQEATNELSAIEGVVTEGQNDYRALEKHYLSLKSQYNVLSTAYDAEVRAFNNHNAQYEKDVDEWNASPKTSQSDFRVLESKRRSLESEAADLKATESRLNALVAEINPLVTQLNTMAKDLNLNVREYNAIGKARGDTFAGGTYTHDDQGERIDIFEFENHEKLVRVLAHELGHALGLEHVEDPEAIMYQLDEGKSDALSATDLSALKMLCAIN